MKTIYWSVAALLTMVFGSACNRSEAPMKAETFQQRRARNTAEVEKIYKGNNVSPDVIMAGESEASRAILKKMQSLDVKGKSKEERVRMTDAVMEEGERAKKRMRDSLYKEKFSPNW